MKVKFSKIERTAGLFVLIAFGAFCFSTVVVATKQGWFLKHHHYKTMFDQGEGIHPGTMVQISGLRAGTVDSVALNDDNRIEVHFTVSHDFQSRIKNDSLARVIRPFIIGDKVVEVTMGSKEAAMLAEGGEVSSEETIDMMDMLGGGKLGPYLKTVDSLLKNVQVVLEAFSDPRRSKAIIGIFDEMLPTLQDVRELSQQMTNHKYLGTSMRNLSTLTQDLNRMLPEMREFSKKLPELGEASAKTMAQLSVLTAEINKVLPTIVAIAPQLPEASQKSVEALKEAVIVLKAMQKSFLLRSAVKDVKEEEEALKKQREPSQAK